jgi:hypothetical protein
MSNDNNDALLTTALESFKSNLTLPAKGKQTYLEEHIRTCWKDALKTNEKSCPTELKACQDVSFVWSSVQQIKGSRLNLPLSSELSVLGVLWEDGVHSMSADLDAVVSAIPEAVSVDQSHQSALVAVLCTYHAGHCWLNRDAELGHWSMHDASVSRSQVFGTWAQAQEKLSSSGR